MTDGTGFILLNRKILNWEWYDHLPTKCLFIHCLLRANHGPVKWRGYDLERGQFLTSLSTLSKETGLSLKQVRLALDNLEKTDEVAKLTSSKNTIITVIKYEQYQSKGTQSGKEGASSGQSEGKEGATDKEHNNDKEYNNNIPASPPKDNTSKKYAFEGRVVKLTYEDFKKWETTYSEIPDLMAEIRAADDYYSENKTKDGKWFFQVSNWLRRAHERKLIERQEKEKPGPHNDWTGPDGKYDYDAHMKSMGMIKGVDY